MILWFLNNFECLHLILISYSILIKPGPSNSVSPLQLWGPLDACQRSMCWWGCRDPPRLASLPRLSPFYLRLLLFLFHLVLLIRYIPIAMSMQQYQLSNSHSFFLLSQQQLAGQCSRLSLPVHRHVYQMPFVEVKQAILVAVIVTRRLGEYASLVPFVQLMEQQPSLNVQLQLL